MRSPLTLLLAAAATLVAAAASPPSPLIGVWIEINGPGAARIAPCPSAPDQLCATGLARRQDFAETGLVLSAVVPDGNNRWRGRYHLGSQRPGATLKLVRSDEVEMKVCLFLFCQSARYQRLRE